MSSLVLAFISPWASLECVGSGRSRFRVVGRLLAQFRKWEEWVNVLLGLWLILPPWILHFSAASKATADAIIVGKSLGCLRFVSKT